MMRDQFVIAINELSLEVYDNNVNKGFWTLSQNFGEKIALIHSELSEALEAHRKEEDPAEHIAEELADAVLRIMDLAQRHNLGLGKAIMQKHQKNLLRPYLHGKRY